MQKGNILVVNYSFKWTFLLIFIIINPNYENLGISNNKKRNFKTSVFFSHINTKFQIILKGNVKLHIAI